MTDGNEPQITTPKLLHIVHPHTLWPCTDRVRIVRVASSTPPNPALSLEINRKDAMGKTSWQPLHGGKSQELTEKVLGAAVCELHEQATRDEKLLHRCLDTVQEVGELSDRLGVRLVDSLEGRSFSLLMLDLQDRFASTR